jgi:nicotinamidase-related amidase
MSRQHQMLFLLTAGLLSLGIVTSSNAQGDKGIDLVLRSRVEEPGNPQKYVVKAAKQTWNPKQTAIIVCDMWDSHHCPNAVKRVIEIAPRMNQVLEKARGMGVLIIHAPSSCMAAYQDHPARKLAESAPPAKMLPKEIERWCYKIDSEAKVSYPIDQTDGGCDCADEEQKAWDIKLKAMGRNPKAPWLSQIDILKIHDTDAISDSGVEIWNLLEARGIDNVILLGVHTNMCVLGRPFGLRQMAKNGKNVVLMRDMTDTMYNPKRSPFVSHFEGTNLIVEYIEKVVCPTITSDQIIGGKEFRFSGSGGK